METDGWAEGKFSGERGGGEMKANPRRNQRLYWKHSIIFPLTPPSPLGRECSISRSRKFVGRGFSLPLAGRGAPFRNRRAERGIMLIDCLMYIVLFFVVTGAAF